MGSSGGVISPLDRFLAGGFQSRRFLGFPGDVGEAARADRDHKEHEMRHARQHRHDGHDERRHSKRLGIVGELTEQRFFG